MDPSPEDDDDGRAKRGRNSLHDIELPGVDTDFDAKPTGVEANSEVESAYVPTKCTEVNRLGQHNTSVVPTERTESPTAPTVETQAPSEPKKGMVARNAKKASKHAMSMAQMSVKLMNKGAHRNANVVSVIMTRLSMKAEPFKKWGLKADYIIT